MPRQTGTKIIEI